jgi:hypothetical protein
MKKLFILLTFLLINVVLNAQTNKNDLLKEAQKWAYSHIEAEAESVVANFNDFKKIKCNLQPVLMYNSNEEVERGFIGSNYQRLRFKFTAAAQNVSQKLVYNVSGKSLVKNNLVAFKGKITIENVVLIRKGDAETYLAIVKYYLAEDVKQKSAGVFEGYGVLKFKCGKGMAQYNDDEMDADGFYNNQFVGTWTSNATKVVKPCNWGDLRIPECGDLDVGAGEFMPNNKYLKFGWQGFYDAVINLSNADEAEEKRKWWLFKK